MNRLFQGRLVYGQIGDLPPANKSGLRARDWRRCTKQKISDSDEVYDIEIITVAADIAANPDATTTELSNKDIVCTSLISPLIWIHDGKIRRTCRTGNVYRPGCIDRTAPYFIVFGSP